MRIEPKIVILSEVKNIGIDRAPSSLRCEALRFAQGDSRRV
jgi:hypothetical protein